MNEVESVGVKESKVTDVYHMRLLNHLGVQILL